MELINVCPRCGGELKKHENNFKCDYCNAIYSQTYEKDLTDKIKDILDEIKIEKVSNLRRRLWEETHEKYQSKNKIVEIAGEIRNILPDDFFATFYEFVNTKPVEEVNKFLSEIDVLKEYESMDIIIEYMIKIMESGNFLSINQLIERTYKDNDLDAYNKYVSLLSDETSKIDEGIYNLDITRDCFIIYSSKDIDKVIELVESLEKDKISCFVALRNLRHGKNAVEDYNNALKKAIDNCRMVVFVSSYNSRSLSCDAYRIELPYIKETDIRNAPAELRNDYLKIPEKYKKPRVHYVVDKPRGIPSDKLAEEIFNGKEWRYDISQVKDAVMNILNSPIEYETEADRIKRELDERVRLQNEQLEKLKKDITAQSSNNVNGIDVNRVLRRCEILLSQKDFSKARTLLDDEVLNSDPENARAYVLLATIDYGLKSEEELGKLETSILENKNIQMAKKFATGEYKEVLDSYIAANQGIIDDNKKYDAALTYKKNKEYEKAYEIFSKISYFKDAKIYALRCKEEIDERLEPNYQKASKYVDNKNYFDAIAMFKIIIPYKDSYKLMQQCQDIVYDMGCKFLDNKDYPKAIVIFDKLDNYKKSYDYGMDARDQMNKYLDGLLDDCEFDKVQDYINQNKNMVQLDSMQTKLNERLRMKEDYVKAKKQYKRNNYQKAANIFKTTKEYKDSEELYEECMSIIRGKERKKDNTKRFFSILLRIILFLLPIAIYIIVVKYFAKY